ncbi:glycosyltransferase family 2 protein [Clostridium saccharobutylicum]|uniref:Hyaluronan synthase n=1 Tax=Clostridium saccharobutylicum TaxID=169679 RepID=A0A1S8NHL6_CLOSA|nr:glycosyltransferase family A protein [Clostridium saccharobutylicum]OOM15969.1 hyaluronan synthase [Clostridium saccharobutylicum]
MNINNDKHYISKDVEAVITSFNQGSMILEAVRSLCNQTTLPARIIIVDDGSTDENSINILNNIKLDSNISVPVTVLQQPNGGVSAARNTGIRRAQTPMVLVLDGDDRLEPSYIEQVSHILRDNPSMIAASSWMHTFGVLDATVCPCGGNIAAFLSRNCCPATHILRREVWKKCGGYDESMRCGFEDWDFFLSMLETMPDTYIGIVERPLIDYRTAPASSNIKSMSKRLDLMHFIIEKHINSYREHVTEAILGIESTSISRLYGWESEILNTITIKHTLSKVSDDFIEHPSYGDGGMAAAVRIASSHK